jgi:hypothetical protein
MDVRRLLACEGLLRPALPYSMSLGRGKVGHCEQVQKPTRKRERSIAHGPQPPCGSWTRSLPRPTSE